MNTTVKTKVLTYLVSLLLSFIILGTSIFSILNMKGLYSFFIKQETLKNPYHLTLEQIQDNYDSLIQFNQSLIKKEFSIPHLPFSKSGKKHFEEVRNIFQFLFYFTMISTVIFLFLVIFYQHILSVHSYLFRGACFSLAFIMLTGLSMWINFSRIFVLFHEIVFRNDLWIFEPSKDPIIHYLPEGYFFLAAMGIAFLITFFSLCCIFLSIFLNKKHTPA